MNSPTRYYLFNTLTLDVGQDSAYDHLFFCRSFNVTYNNQMINGRNFSMQGVDLQYKLIKQVLSSDYVEQALFTTKAINLNMRVVNTENTFCKSNPIATVNMEDVFQTNFSVYNLELRQCNEGVLMADIELVRGTMDQFGKFTHVRSEWHKNIKIGDIGCDPTCQFCTGITAQDCYVCQSNLPFLANGQCYAQCPSYAPYYMTNEVVLQQKLWQAPYCIQNCPLGSYPDLITNECLPCNLDCQTCTKQEIKSCLTCQPVKYLFDGLCVVDCPAPHYQNNFSTYECNQISSTKYLNVTIQSMGYKLKIPKDQQTYLRAIINNNGGGMITSIVWSQLEPVPNSLDMLVFSVSSDGTIQNTAPAVRLKMTALNYISQTQSIKVQCTVTNTMGETAYDIYEFYQNAPPDQLALGATTYLNIFGSLGQGNGTTGDTIYRINATNWDDPDYINFKVYMVVNQVAITLSDQITQNLPASKPTYIYFRIPLISAISSSASIDLCLMATDYSFATATNCTTLPNLANNVQYANNLTLLGTQLLQLTYMGNLTNAVYASQMMFQALTTPQRPPSSPGICTLDFHCNLQGTCQSLQGNQMCICDVGYTGTFCQFQGQELNMFKNVSSQIVSALYSDMSSVAEITVHEIEMVGVILRGILKDPDALDDSMFEQVIEMLEMVGNASLYAFYPVTIDIRDTYMDSLSAVFNKLFHSYKVSRAFPSVVELGSGLSLKAQYNFGMSTINSTISNSSIGGVSARKAMESTTQSGSKYQIWGRRLDLQITIYIESFLPNMNPIYPTYSYQSNVFYFQIQNGLAAQFKGQTIWVEEKDVTWYLPNSVFNNAQGSASDKHEVYLMVMKYLASPFFFENNPGAFVETNVTALTVYDSGGNHINVTLTNANDFIYIMEPYNKTQGFADELLRCMSWNEQTNQFLNDGSCAYNEIYSIVPCITCDSSATLNVTVSLCRCKHLSRFAGVYTQTTPSRGAGPLIGIYVNFDSMTYWYKSFGLFLSIGAGAAYIAGLIICIIIDNQTTPKILKRLIARVKRLELKGFKQKEEKKLRIFRDKHGKIQFIKNDVKKDENGKEIQKQAQLAGEGKVDVDAVIELKKSGYKFDDDEKQKQFNDEGNVAEAYLSPGKKKKSKKEKQSTIGKAFQDEEDNVAEYMQGSKKNKKQEELKEEGEQGEESPSERKRRRKKEKKAKRKQKQFEEDNGYVNENGEYVKGYNNYGDEVEQEEEIEETPEQIEARRAAEQDIIEREMIAKYELEKEVMEFVKEHGTNSDEAEDAGTKKHNQEQKLYLRLERKSRERYWFNLKSLIIHGNGVLSLIFVNSLLMPRHVRFTMVYTNILLNFFWCAVIFKNTNSKLLLPDVSSNTPAQMSSNNLWISIMAPFGATVVMYMFAGLFKISDARLTGSYTLVYLEQMLNELKREMKMKFIIAYCITISIFAAIFWYVIQFTAAFGWHISWIWWYTGCFAIIIQYLGVDLGVSFLQWILNWCSKGLSAFMMGVRIVKMCRQEA